MEYLLAEAGTIARCRSTDPEAEQRSDLLSMLSRCGRKEGGGSRGVCDGDCVPRRVGVVRGIDERLCEAVNQKTKKQHTSKQIDRSFLSVCREADGEHLHEKQMHHRSNRRSERIVPHLLHITSSQVQGV